MKVLLASVLALAAWTASALDQDVGHAVRCEVVASITSAVWLGSDGRESTVSSVITIERVCFGDLDTPPVALGGGPGGESACTTEPYGPLAEVEAVWAAVTAAQNPDPSNPDYVEDVYNPGGTPGNVVVERSWFRVEGTTAQVKYSVSCPDGATYDRWLTVTPDTIGNAVPQVTPADLLPPLQARVLRQLPTPIPRIGPADENPNGWTYVQHPTFFWIDQVPGQWATVSGSTGVGGISVTVQAEPVRLIVDPGDDGSTVICDGAPPAVTRSAYWQTKDHGCSVVYRNSSAMAPNGETYPVTATIVWHATWTASTGAGGDLGYVSTTSPVRDLPVAEIQAVIIDNEP